jgi:hypothetical protein
VGHPSLASEFPNDNAEISSGTIWIHTDLTGPPTAELVSFEPVPSESFVLYFDDDVSVDGPIELEASSSGELTVTITVPAESEVPSAVEPEAPAFAHFERALTATLLARGATRAAALVPRLIRLEPLPAECASSDVRLTLQSRGYLDGNGRYSPKYRDLCGAWSALLQGSSQDFSACGTTTLDRFGADLLAALLTVPATRAEELRRELRKAGVAAFGVLEAA